MKGEAVRWALSAALVAAAHGLIWVALAAPRPDADPDAGSPVVLLDLAPVVAAPAPPPEPAPQAAEPEAQPAPAEPIAEADPPPAPRPDPAPTPVQEPPAPQAVADPDPPPPIPDVVTAPPPAPVPSPAPAPEAPAIVDLPQREPASPPAAVPVVASAAEAETAAAPSLVPGREEAISPTALQSWQRDLLAQIERHKRFPAGAKGRSGVVAVAFRIDRDGRLIDVHTTGSSGSPVLDEAAIDLIRRSEPFPAPPPGLREAELSFVAPVRYLPPALK